MKKILVTTDFSTNSKAAIRFAIQLASQGNASLTFLHVQSVLRRISWNEATYHTYEKKEFAKTHKTLVKFVDTVYKSLKISPTVYTCVVENSPFVDSTIMGYAADHTFDFICISARGAGTIQKLFGTTTANLISQSSVPVIGVPGRYRATKLTHIMYASDLSCLEDQLKRVVDFAEPLAATVELVHLPSLLEPLTDPAILQLAVRTGTHYPVAVRLKIRDLELTLPADLESVVKAQKPDLLIMFTHKTDGFFDRLFLSSNSVDCAYLITIPLLVFSKA